MLFVTVAPIQQNNTITSYIKVQPILFTAHMCIHDVLVEYRIKYRKRLKGKGFKYVITFIFMYLNTHTIDLPFFLTKSVFLLWNPIRLL